MSRSPSTRFLRPREALALIAGVLVLSAIPRVGNDYVLSILFTLLIYVVLTEAYVLFSDFTGYVNLGMSAGVGLGSYVMVLLPSTLPFPAR